MPFRKGHLLPWRLCQIGVFVCSSYTRTARGVCSSARQQNTHGDPMLNKRIHQTSRVEGSVRKQTVSSRKINTRHPTHTRNEPTTRAPVALRTSSSTYRATSTSKAPEKKVYASTAPHRASSPRTQQPLLKRSRRASGMPHPRCLCGYE